MQRSEIIRRAIELGRLHGFVTFNQLNELASPTTVATPEDIEALLNALSDAGINIVEDD